VIEAMACGVPEITAPNSSFRQIVDGAAEVIDPLKAEAIAEALLHLSQGAHLCHKLSQNSLL
jgi:glycosyltransferase involved in cell wall biosynthesis